MNTTEVLLVCPKCNSTNCNFSIKPERVWCVACDYESNDEKEWLIE